MSNLATGLVWERFDGGGTDLLVMLAIADSLNAETGRCDPSYKHLADKTRTSRATVIRSVERLSQAGHLRVIKRTREDNSQRSNVFDLAPGYTNSSAREWLHPATTWSQSDTPLVSECDPSWSQNATPPVALVIPQEPEVNQEDEPGKEPSENGEGSPAKPATPKRAPLGAGAKLFKSLTGSSPNLVQRELLDEAFERHGSAKMEAVIREWLRRGHRKQNADGMVNVMDEGWTKRPANGRPTPPPPDDNTDWGFGTSVPIDLGQPQEATR